MLRFCHDSHDRTVMTVSLETPEHLRVLWGPQKKSHDSTVMTAAALTREHSQVLRGLDNCPEIVLPWRPADMDQAVDRSEQSPPAGAAPAEAMLR